MLKLPQFAARTEVAKLCNVSADVIRRTVEPELPESAKRKGAKNAIELDVVKAVHAFIARITTASGDESIELVKARTELLRLQIEERKGRLIPLEHAEAMFHAFADATRRAADDFQRQYGADAAKRWNGMVKQAVERLEREIARLKATD